ncbi:hypothetical protein GJR96_08420 [Haloferax sp. MBLA0076]|uniref:Uncharacterized protein n=1 Tax=Haloferax litoreum TaxID=2666140 RepID=A0A6A8GGH7_9EURY|nr:MULTISPECIES: sigma-70 family RNA polymerase sigma factor [Haloferax]KAB1193467.1 sigma-70 family RNA polymerase sigma factor [Haloferax sp. CBA1148]MRX21979.1 hypothetical protein [Haloferax litoreum]
MDEKFDPRSMTGALDEIIPPNETTIGSKAALKEMEPVVDSISEDISGIGRKAAQRYLLRYEYGMSTNELASEFDVTPQTISNQVSEVRVKVLKYPRLASVIGTLRAHRSGLSEPDIEDGHTWDGETTLQGVPIEYSCQFRTGSASRPYSWAYLCESRYRDDDTIYHLFVDYLIDAIHGVFLKRLRMGISKKSWERPPITEKHTYCAYPLPNLEIPNNRNGTLLDAAEYHWAYDTKNYFETRVTEGVEKGDLEYSAEDGNTGLGRSAYLTRDDVLSHRIRNCRDPEEAIEEYAEAVFVRNNLERLCLTYPFSNPFDLEYETITQVWNGQPSRLDNYEFTGKFDKEKMYDITINMRSRYLGRDVRAPTKRNSVDMPTWKSY